MWFSAKFASRYKGSSTRLLPDDRQEPVTSDGVTDPASRKQMFGQTWGGPDGWGPRTLGERMVAWEASALAVVESSAQSPLLVVGLREGTMSCLGPLLYFLVFNPRNLCVCPRKSGSFAGN